MCERYGALFIPVVGPFVALGTGVYDSNRDDSPTPGLEIVFAIDGVIQVGGLALLVSGALLPTPADEGSASVSRWWPEVGVGPGRLDARWSF